MRQFADGIIDSLCQGRLDADLEKHSQPEKYFVGSSAAKHCVPRSFPKSNPTQKAHHLPAPKEATKGSGRTGKLSRRGAHKDRSQNDNMEEIEEEEQLQSEAAYVAQIEEDDVLRMDIQTEEDIVSQSTNTEPFLLSNTNKAKEPRRNPARKRHGRNRRYEDPDQYSTDEEVREFDLHAPTSQQETVKLAANPPTYCFLRRPPEHLHPPIKMRGVKKYPKRCNGCLLPFPDELYEPPLNLVFHFKTVCEWFSDGKHMTSKKPENAYYHSQDMACLRHCPELERVTIDNCYMEQACFAQLTEEHKKLLKQQNHWNPIRRNSYCN